MNVIKSENNDLIKKVKKLKLKKFRDKENLFIAEGKKFLDYLENVDKILIREDVLVDEEILNKIDSTKIYFIATNIFNKISSQENSQGVIIVYKKIKEIKFGNNIVVLDNISDPGNMGTIFRTIDAVGLKDIIIIKGSNDAYCEKTIRSSMGSIFNLNIKYMDLKDSINFLKKEKYNINVSNLSEKSIDYKSMKVVEKNAFIFGNEGHGVSKEFIDNADSNIKIPIYGKAESLNVAIACAIILYKFKEIIGDENKK